MARMPRGEPRSVPDLVGEQYDAMIRQERLSKLGFKSTPTTPRLVIDKDYFSPFADPVARLDHGDLDPLVVQQACRPKASHPGTKDQNPSCGHVRLLGHIGPRGTGLLQCDGRSPRFQSGGRTGNRR